MELDTVWTHIHAERRALAQTLASLSADEWEHGSLCTGWVVKDVAAHVIANPQLGFARVMRMLGRNVGRSYHAMVFRETKRLSALQSTDQILADFATYGDSRKHVATTTTIEPLLDCLVHHQDIVRPLGLRHAMPPDAAVVAADRARRLSFFFGTRSLLKGVRLAATDIDWVRGRGPTIEGPMQELLMLCTGRAKAATHLAGDGRQLLEARR